MTDPRRARSFLVWLFFCLFLGFSRDSFAQSQGFTLDQFDPAPAGDRFFLVPGADPGGHLVPRAMLLADYAYRPLVLYEADGETEVGPLVSDQLFLHAAVSLSLWDRLLVSLNQPIALAVAGDSPTVPGAAAFASPSGAALGDLRLGARVRLLGAPVSIFRLSLAGSLWLPTGDPDRFASDGKVRGLPAIVVDGISGSFVYAASVGSEMRRKTRFSDTTLATKIQYSAGAGLLFVDRRLQVGPEIYGSAAMVGRSAFDRGTTNLEGILGAKYRIGDFVFGAGAGPGITRGLGTPALRGVASIAYSPDREVEQPPSDRDHDKILDAVDACPDDFGAPSDDPLDHGCPDRDKDGIRDPRDDCPDVPGVASDEKGKNGCPPDRDGDGILDTDDACPDVPGVKNEDPKLNGCPPDRDGDGILDDDDACPDVPGVKSEDPAQNGCPPDSDGDGIRDDKDACPHEKGVPDPDPQKNGCPTLVRVTEKEILILEQVQFKTASAVILPASDVLLEQVATVLREHPEILSLEVRGHTDNRGGAVYNKGLSNRRATSVVKWLTTKGEIAAERLVPVGFGLEEPIADNTTEEGRQKNRRVEFKIIKTKQESSSSSEETP